MAASFVAGCGSASLAPRDGGAGQGGGAAGANGAAGAAAGASGAAQAPKPTCGGDLVGLWATSQKNLPPPDAGPSGNACFNLMLTRDGDTFSASTSNPRFGPERDITIAFMPSGAFSVEDMRRGPVTVHYAAACLASPMGTPTCDELAPAIEISGHNTGEFQSATCAASPSGGCDCTLDLSVVTGPSGTWSVSGAGVTFVNAFSSDTTTSSYCADASGLRFDPAIEALVPGGSSLVFQRVDCADGRQGPVEEGVDCGWVCRIGCP